MAKLQTPGPTKVVQHDSRRSCPKKVIPSTKTSYTLILSTRKILSATIFRRIKARLNVESSENLVGWCQVLTKFRAFFFIAPSCMIKIGENFVCSQAGKYYQTVFEIAWEAISELAVNWTGVFFRSVEFQGHLIIRPLSRSTRSYFIFKFLSSDKKSSTNL